MSHPGVPRGIRPIIVTLDAGSPARVRFHALVVRAYREWEGGAGAPRWLRCSADRPGAVAPRD